MHLTEAGREIHGQAVATRADLIEQIFGVLTERQLTDLAATLRQIDAEVTRASESLAT